MITHIMLIIYTLNVVVRPRPSFAAWPTRRPAPQYLYIYIYIFIYSTIINSTLLFTIVYKWYNHK